MAARLPLYVSTHPPTGSSYPANHQLNYLLASDQPPPPPPPLQVIPPPAKKTQ